MYSLLLNLEDKRSPFSGGNCFPSHPINFGAREARSAFIAEFLLKYGFVCTDFLELLSLVPLDLELVESDDKVPWEVSLALCQFGVAPRPFQISLQDFSIFYRGKK